MLFCENFELGHLKNVSAAREAQSQFIGVINGAMTIQNCPQAEVRQQWKLKPGPHVTEEQICRDADNRDRSVASGHDRTFWSDGKI